MKIISSILSVLLIFTLVAPNMAFANKESLQKEHTTVESYEIETLADELNEDYIYENTGTKKVQAITTIIEKPNKVESEITSIQDYYDLEGNFLKSVVLVENFSNNYKTGEATYKQKEKQYKTPQILNKQVFNTSPDEKFKEEILTTDKKEKIKSGMSAKLQENGFKEKEERIKGLTYEDIETIKEYVAEQYEAATASTTDSNSAEAQGLRPDVKDYESTLELEEPTYSALYVERNGAFDTYYNHDTTTGKFTAQALSATARKYVKTTGTTLGNSKNAGTLAKFKNATTNWKYYVEQKMRYNAFPEVAGWVSALMGLGVLVAGFGVGPAGWVSIVLNSASAFSVFLGFTSSYYATASRLDMSRVGAQYNQNARNLMYYTNWSGVSRVLVWGY